MASCFKIYSLKLTVNSICLLFVGYLHIPLFLVTIPTTVYSVVNCKMLPSLVNPIIYLQLTLVFKLLLIASLLRPQEGALSKILLMHGSSKHKITRLPLNIFKVELTIILNGFLNIWLSFARRECNADRCPSRKCAKYTFCVNSLVPVLT